MLVLSAGLEMGSLGGGTAVGTGQVRVHVQGDADSLEAVGEERWQAPENSEFLSPGSAEMPPRASVLLSRDWPPLSSAVTVLLNDLCRDEKLLFLQIHFEPDPAVFACIQQLDFINPMGFPESDCVLNPPQLEYWCSSLVL